MSAGDQRAAWSIAGLRGELRALARLALPIAAAQLGMMAMNLVDTAIVGHHDKRALAALVVGNSYQFLIAHFGLGVLMALDPVVSQAIGACDERGVTRGFQRGAALAVLVTLPVALVLYLADLGLTLLQQPAEVIPVATDYLHASIPGLPAFYLFFALRLGLQAMHRMRAIVIAIVLANAANALLDWTLVTGGLGMPALGATGCGIATSVCRWLLLIAILAFGRHELVPRLRHGWRESLRLAPLWRMLRLGTPIGVQNVVEAAAFASIAFQMGWFGEHELGGHGIALMYAAFAFMLPVGIASAVAVRVGRAVGATDQDAVRRAAIVAMAGGGGVMLLSAALFVIVPGPLARVFSDTPEVVALAVALLPIAGVFQVFDGLQVVGAGVLRGIGDVRFPMLIHLYGFWCAGIPGGYLLAFELGLGPRGLWWGLLIGLALVALVFLWRIRVQLSRSVARIEIDRA